MSAEREIALESLIRSLQHDADLEVDMWREVGNSIMQYTNAKRALLSKLSKVFVSLENNNAGQPKQMQASQPLPSQPLPSTPYYPSQPLPSMPYPAYQDVGPVMPASYPGPGGYPSSSSQSPWPPELVPQANVPRHAPSPQQPQNKPHQSPQQPQQPPPQPASWSLKSALTAASRGQA